ncbi:hypothetical protein [Nocardia amamiensis]|uniref:hypothetical protein n=1 Tax=Nocardia amamiensis TaxID=404578 RepID=UPI0033CB5CAB
MVADLPSLRRDMYRQVHALVIGVGDLLAVALPAEFRITTHDAGRKLTDLDFELARHIDRISAAAGATPVTDP